MGGSPDTWRPRPFYANEHQFQADCVLWFANTYPQHRGRLWANFAEQNKIQAGIKLSLGLVSGLPDLMFAINSKFYGIELKLPHSVHKVEHLIHQAQWLIDNTNTGFFCDTLDGFKYIIENLLSTEWRYMWEIKTIHPESVLNYCQTLKTKTTTWNSDKFTIKH